MWYLSNKFKVEDFILYFFGALKDDNTMITIEYFPKKYVLIELTSK